MWKTLTDNPNTGPNKKRLDSHFPRLPVCSHSTPCHFARVKLEGSCSIMAKYWFLFKVSSFMWVFFVGVFVFRFVFISVPRQWFSKARRSSWMLWPFSWSQLIALENDMTWHDMTWYDIWYDMIWYDMIRHTIQSSEQSLVILSWKKIATWNPHVCEVFHDACGLPTKCMSVCDRACQTAYTHDNLHGTPRNHRAMPRHSLGPATAQVAPPILLWANSTVKNQKPKATLPIKHSILLSATWCFLLSTCFEKFEHILEKTCFEDARTVLLERLRIWLMFPTVQWITGSCTTTVIYITWTVWRP